MFNDEEVSSVTPLQDATDETLNLEEQQNTFEFEYSKLDTIIENQTLIYENSQIISSQLQDLNNNILFIQYFVGVVSILFIMSLIIKYLKNIFM